MLFLYILDCIYDCIYVLSVSFANINAFDEVVFFSFVENTILHSVAFYLLSMLSAKRAVQD